MSFYKDILAPLDNSDIATMQFTIIDMYTVEDHAKIKDSLLQIDGVAEIKSYERPKKLVVGFDIRKTNVETIVFTISRMGYRYINRACKKCGFA